MHELLSIVAVMMLMGLSGALIALVLWKMNLPESFKWLNDGAPPTTRQEILAELQKLNRKL